jgi:hypothetical protein
MKLRILLLTIVLLLLLVHGADGMSSANYRLDWFTPLTGSGGPASSAAYSINFTVGQTASHTSSSPLYRIQTGYWAGVIPDEPTPPPLNFYLPGIMNSH